MLKIIRENYTLALDVTPEQEENAPTFTEIENLLEEHKNAGHITDFNFFWNLADEDVSHEYKD